MTRKILLISDDGDFKGFLNIATLTLTKLNHQITITEDKNDGHIDWIIVDMDTNTESNFEYIQNTRNSEKNKNLKIVSVLTNITNEIRKQLFQYGCDSIMTKKEFRAAANNLLVL
jgi:CheY-like chemotaxis protein